MGVPKNQGVETFPDPAGHFGAPWWLFLILQAVWRYGVACGERVPPLPLGWYIQVLSPAGDLVAYLLKLELLEVIPGPGLSNMGGGPALIRPLFFLKMIQDKIAI